MCIFRRGLAWLDGYRERHMDDIEPAIQAPSVANDDDLFLPSSADKPVTKLGAYAGRLTGGYNEWPAVRHT